MQYKPRTALAWRLQLHYPVYLTVSIYCLISVEHICIDKSALDTNYLTSQHETLFSKQDLAKDVNLDLE